MAYQDRWVNGTTEERGDRACADRYELIRPVLRSYKRPFTVWDLGANLGYFGCRIASEFSSVSVMADQRPALVDACRANALPNTIAMTHRLTAQDLVELAASEHADVVLALNVLHHFADWSLALRAMCQLGETVIVETPGIGDVNTANFEQSQELLEALSALDPECLGESPSHVTPGVYRPMFLLRRPKCAVTASYSYRQRVRARGPHSVRPHVITSTPTEKTIAYHDGESRPWVHGMNLWNWLQMGGSYPDRQSVQQAARIAAKTMNGPHGDFKPWNLILQGQELQVIDVGHRQSVSDDDGLKQTVAWIARPESAYVS